MTPQPRSLFEKLLCRPKETTEDSKYAQESQFGIRLSLDSFDASIAKGKDVAGPATLGPPYPQDFLMYFKDYDHGEGQ